VTAMSKRTSLAEPPSQATIPEAKERPTPRRSQTNLSQGQRPPIKTVRTEAPALSISPASSKTSGAKSSVPPSPTRRASSTMANPRVPQQSLDAAAQLLAPRPSDVGSRQPISAIVPPVRSSSVDHQNGRPSVSPMSEKRPRLTTEIPSSATTSGNGNTSLAVPPLPRRTATAPASPVEKWTRPRRHTNASTKDISSPVLDHGQPASFSWMPVCFPHFIALDATKNMCPIKKAAGKPIPTRDFQVQTKRLSTG